MLTPEILIIGAGPAGSAAAHKLAEAGHEILLLDKATFPRDKVCGDGLTPMAVKTLSEMNLLDSITAAGAVRIDYARITAPLGVSATVSFSDYQSDAAYAMVLPRLKLDEILLQYAVQGGVEFLGQARVETLEMDNDRVHRVEVRTPSGPLTICPEHVIIAVGANTGLMKKTGLVRHKPRYIRAARAYYTQVQMDEPLYDFYFDFELLPGYGWIFPTGNGTANIGIGVLPLPFIAPSQSGKELLEGFIKRRVRDGVFAAPPELQGSIKGYPLRIDFPAQRAAGKNWVIVGEAAGLVNPVTGEGIDLALESGLLAARTLHEDIAQGRRNHLAYQREIWQRFGPMFSGLRILRDLVMIPVVTDYAIWLMKQHKFITRAIMRMTQGLEPPQGVFHPLFVLQFFMPISPRFAVSKLGQWLSRGAESD